MGTSLLAVRILVLAVGSLGALAAGFFGVLALVALSHERPKFEEEHRQVEKLRQLMGDAVKGSELETEFAKAEAAYRANLRTIQASYYLMAGLVLGTGGALLGFRGRKAGAALLLVAGLGPLVLSPRLVMVGVTSGLLLAGLLCLFVVPPRPKRNRPEEDDEPRPPRRRSRVRPQADT
jgi:hypothetical protein